MALTDEVTSRYSTARLRSLTNPDSPSSSVDTARLALAATDAQAEFERRIGLVYDSTDADHVAVAVEGVIVRLLEFGANLKAAASARASWEKRAELLRDTHARAWAAPDGTSVMTPTRERVGSKPDMDRSRLASYLPAKVAAPDILEE